jgi:hypothetical protein
MPKSLVLSASPVLVVVVVVVVVREIFCHENSSAH